MLFSLTVNKAKTIIYDFYCPLQQGGQPMGFLRHILVASEVQNKNKPPFPNI